MEDPKMNPIDNYRDSSLDGLIEPRSTSTRKSGGSRHTRRTSAAQDPYYPSDSAASHPPSAPTIAYPGTDVGENKGLQRSFSQRARGRPYADEAYLDEDMTLTNQAQPSQRHSSTRYASNQEAQAPLPSIAKDRDDASRRQQIIQENIKSAAGSVRSPRDHTSQGSNAQASTYEIDENTGNLSKEVVHGDNTLPADQRDWAPDRSPLQKLEVTLNDISKEEKRARVQEAEMLHREKTRSQRPSQRGSTTTQRTQPTSTSHPSTIEDAGIVRSLSNTHRDRLNHSTTIESHKPDATRLSTDRPSGQTFDYQASNIPFRSVTITRRGKLLGSPEEIASRRSASGPQAPQYADSSRGSGQNRSVSATQPRSQITDPVSLPVSASQTTSQKAPSDSDRGLSVQERDASHQAALEQLTGSAPTTRTKSGSRRSQMDNRDASRLPPTSGATRGLSTATDQTQSGHRGLNAQSGVTAGSTLSTGADGRQTSTNPFSEPIGSNVQTTPGSKRRSSVSFKEPYDRRRPVDEWKAAETARLAKADFLLEAQDDPSQNKAWWEQDAKSRRRSSRARTTATSENIVVDDRVAEFQPRLYLKCGPLLRYTGMKRTMGEGAKEYWRGTVMMVTQDSQSSYETPPSLRLFSQPKTLLARTKTLAEGEQLPAEQVDPIAGTTKISRIGRALYVRPVENLPESQDLSHIETDDGLFQSSPPMTNSEGESVTVPPLPSRSSESNGEKFGRYKEIRGVRLYADPDRDVTFWLFMLEVQLGPEQQHIGYRINGGAASGFWVPAEGQTMNMMFHSCNGFSMSVKPDDFSGPDPMWRDVLNSHQSRPFHVMIGGGDQIYNDKVMNRTHFFKEWTSNKNPHYKHHAPFTHEMKEELESFYLDNYCTWFSQGLFAVAGAQIPMVNMWDDHDIIDGFGSYPHAFQLSPVFSGVGNVAFKYYMLFQQHSVDAMTQADEPSWLLGYKPGPYIKQLSRSIFVSLGRSVALLALDCRTERMKNQVLSLDTCDMALERCRKEMVEGETKHLVILLGVPIAYPRMNWLENILTSRAMDPVKAMGRYGVLKGGALNRFDGGVEVLDDLDDHWTANHHKEERNEFIKELQDLAAERSVRITILGGDVHLCAIGQFYSNPKLKIPKDRDHRYMPNVISSAIVNTPPPEMLADVLNKRNKVHHLDQYTDESMIPMFTHDTNLKKRNNKHMLPRRNWCSITEYVPGRTPPSSRSSSPSRSEFSEFEEREATTTQPKRRFSLSKDDLNPRMLFRRMSSRNAPPTAYREGGDINDEQRASSFDGVRTNRSEPRSWTGQSQRRTASETREPGTNSDHATGTPYDSRQPPPLRPGFHRRPTNLSEKAAKKGNVPAVDADGNEFDVNDHVNLDGGLDIVLNCEVDQHDPSGITEPYRLLVPALWYDGSSDREKLDSAEAGGLQRKPTLMDRMGLGGRKGQKAAQNQGAGNWGQDMTDTESYSSGSEEIITETTDKPQKKKFGFLGSFRKKRPEDEYWEEKGVPRHDQFGSDNHVADRPITNREAALNSTSIHDQVTTAAPNQNTQPHLSSQAAPGTYDSYDNAEQARTPTQASFNRPPGHTRDLSGTAPQRTSSQRSGNVLRKNSRKQAGSHQPVVDSIATDQRPTGQRANDHVEPTTPTRQSAYMIGSNGPSNPQYQNAQASQNHPYDPDSAYLSSQASKQNGATRTTSNPLQSNSTTGPSFSQQQQPIPGNATSNSTLQNPKQRSLSGRGILGRFSSHRSTSADQVPSTTQQSRDSNMDFQPAPPQRTTSQGYSGIEAYREKPKRGLSFKDRTRNFFDKIDGRRRNDDGSDTYSYSSEESWSSDGLGEVDDQGRDQRVGQGQGPPQDQTHRHANRAPQSNRQDDRYDDDQDSYVDDFDGAEQRPGMARGLSQKIRLNMMRFGSMGGGGGRTRDGGKDRDRIRDRDPIVDRDQSRNEMVGETSRY